MQTLWSRAAQSKCSCRCSGCLSSATAVARRTTTATGRRRLKAGEAFTLFYSSIFATAAVADAKIKENRRDEWDRVITEARGALNSPRRDEASTELDIRNLEPAKKNNNIKLPSATAMPKRSNSKLSGTQTNSELFPVVTLPPASIEQRIMKTRKQEKRRRNRGIDGSGALTPASAKGRPPQTTTAARTVSWTPLPLTSAKSRPPQTTTAVTNVSRAPPPFTRTPSLNNTVSPALGVSAAPGINTVNTSARILPELRSQLDRYGCGITAGQLGQAEHRQEHFPWHSQPSSPPTLRDQASEAESVEALGNIKYFRANNLGMRPLPPNSVQLSSEDRVHRPVAPLSLKKLKTLECSVAKLVARLVLQANLDEEVEVFVPHLGALQDLPVLKRSALRQHLQRLEACLAVLPTVPMGDKVQTKWFANWQSPQYPLYTQPDLSLNPNEGKLQNDFIRAVLKNHASGDLDVRSMIDKICYNLLISNTPPDIDTYNLLIMYLCRLRQNEMVLMVMDSMFESHVRPNEITVSAILKYLAASRNRNGFTQFVRLMQGFDGGLSLAREGAKITSASKGRLTRLPNGEVVQKALYNRHIFGALIDGSLKLFGVTEAMRWYRAMLQEGYLPDLAIASSFLRNCAQTANWGLGRWMWGTLSSCVNEDSASTIRPDDRAYFWMLQLCRNCKRHQMFTTIYTEATSRGYYLDRLLYSPLDTKKPASLTIAPQGSPELEIPRKRLKELLLMLERPSHPINQLSWRLSQHANRIRKFAEEANQIERHMLINAIEAALRTIQVQVQAVASSVLFKAIEIDSTKIDSILRNIQYQIHTTISEVQSRINAAAGTLRSLDEELYHIRVKRISSAVEYSEDEMRHVAIQLLCHDLTEALSEGRELLRRTATRTAALVFKHFRGSKRNQIFKFFRTYHKKDGKSDSPTIPYNQKKTSPDTTDETTPAVLDSATEATLASPLLIEPRLVTDIDVRGVEASQKSRMPTTVAPADTIPERSVDRKAKNASTSRTRYPADTPLLRSGLFAHLPASLPYSLESRQAVDGV